MFYLALIGILFTLCGLGDVALSAILYALYCINGGHYSFEKWRSHAEW